MGIIAVLYAAVKSFNIPRPIGICLLIALTCPAAQAQPVSFSVLPDSEVEALNRTAGLQYDIDYLVHHAQARHADPTRPAFAPAFINHATTLRNRIGELSDLAVLTGLRQLVALLDDGHSTIYGPGPDTPLTITSGRLPLRFYWFEEGLYIIDGQGDSKRYAGSQVLRLGELSPSQVMQRLAPLRGTDNDMTLLWMGPQFFLPDIANLSAIGATTSSSSIEISLRDLDGNLTQVSVTAGAFPLIRKLRPSPASSNPVPLYLQRVDSNFWMTPLALPGTLYLQFNQVRNNADMSIQALAKHLAHEIKRQKITHLIVDVRHNNGGNNQLLRPLIQQLIVFEQSNDRHQLYIMTGRNTFSAAQNFINRVERWTDAIFVGEPSASSPNFVGEETPFTLPYSRISGSLSDRYWQDSDPGDERQWITPDIRVPVTAADYFQNRDAALEAVLAHIESLESQ